MKAQQLTSEDGPQSLQLVDLPEPAAGPGEVLIDVEAAGVSFVDLLMTRGQYQDRPELPFVPGLEVAGLVREAPDGAAVRAGDRVAAYLPRGGYAEVAAAPVATTFALPDQLDFAGGAAVALNFPTAHFALVHRGRVQPGQRVLVHGAAGGVGIASIQVAKASGATVVAVVHRADTAELARRAGADAVVVASENWAKEARQEAPRGFHLVVDPVGGNFFYDSIRLLAPEGTHLVVGFAAGGIPSLKLNRILLRNVAVAGVGWGAFLGVDATIGAVAAADLRRWVDGGLVRPEVGSRLPLQDAPEALNLLAEHRTNGKVVLDVRVGR
jgi:NADPH:quinone reductase